MKRAFLLVTFCALFLGVSEAHAWVEPTLAPPLGNVTAPLRLDSNGFLGIGVTPATQKLHVVSTSANQTLANFACAAGGFCQVIVSDGTRTGDIGVNSTAVYLGSNSAHPLQIRAGATTRMLISHTTGNVGIGNTNPGSALHVGAGGTLTIPNGAGTGFTSQIANSQSSGVAGISVGVNDGTNNRRIGLFADNTNGVVGISSLYSSGAPAFVYRDGTAERLRINSTGNMGLGNAAPAYRLDVTGDVNVTGCFRVAGTCLSAGGLGGTGTINYLSKFTAASTLGNSQLFDNGTNVGIGTATPGEKLQVVGSLRLGASNVFPTRVADIWDNSVLTVQAGSSAGYGTSISLGARSASFEGITFSTRDTERVRIDPSGNVGIGISSPTQALTVNGNINKSGSWIIANPNWGSSALEVHTPAWDNSSNNNYGTIAAGKMYAYNGLQSGGATGAEATDGQLYVVGRSMLMGNVGVGTSAASLHKLNVIANEASYAAVYGENAADVSWGVMGKNTSPYGGTGVRGEGGIGVYGLGNSGTSGGIPTGVSGSGGSEPGGIGVRGVSGTGGTAVGVLGTSNDGYGIQGRAVYGYALSCISEGPALCGGNRAWTNTSDERLKKNISTVTNGLDKVLKLRGVNFNWREGDTEKQNIGFIAQEVMDVVPEVVSKNKEGYYSINESSLNAVLVEAIKELKSENDDLKSRIEKLEAKIK